MKQKLYGLRIKREVFPQADHVVWVSTFESKLAEHQRFVQESVDRDCHTVFEQVCSDVLVDNTYWYVINDSLCVKIDKLTDLDCIGSIFKVKNGKIAKNPCGRSSWYLNGQSNNSLCKLPIIKEYEQ